MKNEKTFLATVMNIFEYYFNEKHKILLKGSKKYILKFISIEMKIPKIDYKGKSMEFQRVKGKKQPKIEVLEPTENEI